VLSPDRPSWGTASGVTSSNALGARTVRRPHYHGLPLLAMHTAEGAHTLPASQGGCRRARTPRRHARLSDEIAVSSDERRPGARAGRPPPGASLAPPDVDRLACVSASASLGPGPALAGRAGGASAARMCPELDPGPGTCASHARRAGPSGLGGVMQPCRAARTSPRSRLAQ